MTEFPWIKSTYDALVKSLDFNRLPHALLLYGQKGIGKHEISIVLAKRILCHQPVQSLACGGCKACMLFSAGSHPDFLLIEPENSVVIKVDQIRKVIDFVYQTPQLNHNKVIVVHPAYAMNRNAENALLKCLEEPVANTFFLVETEQLSQLLPTTVSRCRQFCVNKPDDVQVIQWLQSHCAEYEQDQLKLVFEIFMQSPRAAYDFLTTTNAQYIDSAIQKLSKVVRRESNIIDFAQQIEKENLAFFLLLTIYILRSNIKFHVAQVAIPYPALRVLSESFGSEKSKVAFQFLSWTEESLSQLLAGSNLNKVMMTEKLLIHWSQLAL